MKHSEKVMSVAAVLTALSTLACCLPLGIVAAVGVAGLGVIIEPLRPWLLGLSLIFLTIGLSQLYRRDACQMRSRTSVVIFWVAAAIVLGVALFPQLVASFFADQLP